MKNTIPATYSSRDSYERIEYKKFEILKEDLIKTKNMPKEWYDVENKYLKACIDKNHVKMNECCHLQNVIENGIREKYFSWENEKYNLESYDFVEHAIGGHQLSV